MVTTSGCVLTRCKVRTGDCYCPTTGNGTRRGWGTDGSTDYWMERLVESWFGVPLGCGCFRAAAWETELGPSSRQSTEALRSLSFLVAVFVVRTWNLVHYFLYASYLTVTFPVCGRCLWSTALDFSGDFSATRGRFSWFDSGYMFCISIGRLEELHTFSTLRQTLFLIAFPLHSVEWRRVLS